MHLLHATSKFVMVAFSDQHEIMEKKDKTIDDLMTLRRVKKFIAHCSGVEPKDKPLTDGYHEKIERNYNYLYCWHQAFIRPSDKNAFTPWKTRFYYQSNKQSSYFVCFPYSTFYFIVVEPAIIKIQEKFYKSMNISPLVMTMKLLWMSYGLLMMLIQSYSHKKKGLEIFFFI